MTLIEHAGVAARENCFSVVLKYHNARIIDEHEWEKAIKHIEDSKLRQPADRHSKFDIAIAGVRALFEDAYTESRAYELLKGHADEAMAELG